MPRSSSIRATRSRRCDRRHKIVRQALGRTSFDWLQIELLFVPAALRGQAIGRGLMAEAERIAVTRGCHGAWLDTFSFQARGFYEALGYELLATLPDHPRGEARHFLRKLLPPA